MPAESLWQQAFLYLANRMAAIDLINHMTEIKESRVV